MRGALALQRLVRREPRVAADERMAPMTTYPIQDAAGRPFAFEVENVYLTLSKATALLKSADGVSDVRQRRLFRRPTDVHVRFRYRGVPFVLWEPYADSSPYWIGPEDEQGDHVDVGDLRVIFDRHDPPFVLKAFGYLLSFRFLVPTKHK